MTTARAKLFEHHLGGPIKAHLESRGLTVSQEVRHTDEKRVTRAADIIAISSSLTVAVEMKLTTSTELLAQAVHWLDFADEVWIAVPALTSKAPAAIEARQLAIAVCAWKGIGVLTVRRLEQTEEIAMARGVAPDNPIVVVVHEAERQHGRNVAELRDALRPGHSDGSHAAAGSKLGVRLSKTQERNEAVRVYLESRGGLVPLEEMTGLKIGGSLRIFREDVEAKKVPCVRINGCGPVIMLEIVREGYEAPVYSERDLRTAPRDRVAHG